MAYKQTMGKGPAMKTGAGIPKELMSGPAMHEGVVHEGKKPKGTTTRTQEKTTQNGQTGTLTTDTTVTPGYKTSADFTGKPKPSYKEFGARGGDVEAAKKWNRERAGSTDVQSRFLADPIATSMKPMGIIPGKANIKAEGIKQGINFTPPTETTTGGGGGGFGDVVETVGDVVGNVGNLVSKAFTSKPKSWNNRSLVTRIKGALRGCFGGGC